MHFLRLLSFAGRSHHISSLRYTTTVLAELSQCKAAYLSSAFHSRESPSVEASVAVKTVFGASRRLFASEAAATQREALDEASTDQPNASSRATYDGVFSVGPPPFASWQKAMIAVGSAVGALADPARADLVAALGETTGIGAYQRMLSQMRQTEEGQRLLREKPRVTAQSVAHAWDCAPGTFGAAYAHFMGSRNFSADDRPTVRFVEDQDLAFVAARAREVHDFWHVLFGLPTTVTGELALKMVELVQTGMPMCALSVIGGPLRLSADKRQVLRSHYFPWAVKAGLRCVDLMAIDYEHHFHKDLDHLRATWRIIPASKPRPQKT